MKAFTLYVIITGGFTAVGAEKDVYSKAHCFAYLGHVLASARIEGLDILSAKCRPIGERRV